MPSSSSGSYTRLVRRLGRAGPELAPVEPGDDLPAEAERVALVVGEVVGQPGDAGVHLGAAERLVVGLLAGRHLHQRRAAEEDLRPLADHHHVVAHARHVRAAGGGVAEDQRDGRDAGRGQPGQVAEDPPARDEDLRLGRQVGAAGLDQVDQRQPVLPRRCRAARKDFFTVHGLLAPPRTVGSLAMITHSTPETTPMPVTSWRRPGSRCPRRPAGTAPGTARPGRAAARSARGPAACRGRGAGRRTWAAAGPGLGQLGVQLGQLRQQRLPVRAVLRGRDVHGGAQDVITTPSSWR